MESKEAARWATYLDTGILQARELDRITSSVPDLTLDDAYQIQEEGIRLRQSRGEKIIGYKMGLTSRAKREQMNLRSSIYGLLTDRMRVTGEFDLQGKIHPKIEPEIAFHISRELHGHVTAEQVLESCSGVSAALEILDSRYIGFKYFSLPDVVADNSSSSYFQIGAPLQDFRVLDLARLEMEMGVNGAVAQKAVSNEISGNPVNSVIQLCELLHARGKSLPAGSIVLAGAATVAVQLEKGQKITLKVSGLPEVTVQVKA